MNTATTKLPGGGVPRSYRAPIAPTARAGARPSAALIVTDLLALLGVLCSGIALFAQGWVHATIVFPMPGRGVDFVARTFGFDVDRELARIANNEVSKVLPPTLWQFGGHAFQGAFGLLVLMAVLLLVGLCVARVRVVGHLLALLAAAGAVSLIVTTVLGKAQQSESLPGQVAKTASRSALVNRAFAATTGKPQLVVTVGWPLYAAAAGVVLVMLGVIVGLIVAARGRAR